jgi:hypothetical protein
MNRFASCRTGGSTYFFERVDSGREILMPQNCIVFIPHEFGGHHSYDMYASSSSYAAWQAIQDHERTHKITLAG